MSDYIQFDTAETVIGGVNIAEAVQSDKNLVFNESYTVTGRRLAAPSVYACYDLTVVGDMEVEEIEIKGNLYVIGDIKAKRLSCLKAIICSGNIDAAAISGSEIVANDIACHSITCPGSIIARTTIDISEALNAGKSVLTGEGILGNGQFSAKNAVAAEYFDFNGEVLGKVLELETDAVFGEPHSESLKEETFAAFSAKLKARIADEIKKAGEVGEEQLIDFVNQLSEIDEDMLSDWKKLTENLAELSYLNRITNFRDYLIIIMAGKVLPKEIVGYETMEHVFDNLLIEAEKGLDTLPFHAKDVEDLSYALKIITLCGNEIGIEKDEALDRIFQSIGIKYKTVKSFLG